MRDSDTRIGAHGSMKQNTNFFRGKLMRITKRDVSYQMRCLAKETGMKLELEQTSYRKHNYFSLLQVDENGAFVKTLIEDDYTTKEMFLTLRAAREICKVAKEFLV